MIAAMPSAISLNTPVEDLHSFKIARLGPVLSRKLAQALAERAGELAPGQEGSIHFEYLLERHGGFVIDSRNLDEHVGNLARVLKGEVNTGSLTRFAERFVRPEGLERPVSPVVAAVVLEHSRRTASERPRLVAR